MALSESDKQFTSLKSSRNQEKYPLPPFTIGDILIYPVALTGLFYMAKFIAEEAYQAAEPHLTSAYHAILTILAQK